MDQFNQMNSDIILEFSTLSRYSEAISHLKESNLYNYHYDMLPYTDNGSRYFTGQYTSRANLKAAIREAS